MGGKQKQAQRTKGNVKPSSSGRSASLLGNVTNPGFSGLKEGSIPFPTFPVFQPTDDLDPNIDPKFYLVLKKMTKKDSTTRLKAIQEFSKLVEESDTETVRGVLPFWPRLYNIVANDIDHRVREAAHRAQGITVVHTKKHMAPYLRQVAGSWFSGQFDTYHPSADAASNALKDAFPPKKFVEAIVFCQEEIVKFLCDTLLEHVPQLASKNRDESEVTEKQIRLVVSSLQGYAHLLRILPEESLSNATLLKNSETMLESTFFWKLRSDKIPMIRSSWFSAVTAILEKVPQLLADQHKQVVKAVVERLNEVDVVVLPLVWQAFLQILKTFDDWEEYCNIEEHIIPRLLVVIYEGAYRCASVVFPMVLPLLSSFLPKVSDKRKFANSIFATFREGFAKKTMGVSSFNNEATAQCYMECIRYVAANGILDSGLIEEHVLSVLELTGANMRLLVLYQAFGDEISSLLRYWINNERSSCHRELYQCFWGYLPRVISKGLGKFPELDTGMKELILIQHVDLCSSLQEPFRSHGKKKPLQVRFHVDMDKEGGEKNREREGSGNLIRGGMSKQESKSHLCEKLSKNLTEFIQKLCEMYFEEIKEKNDVCYIYPVAELLVFFDSKSIFDSLSSNWELVDLLIDIHNKFIEVSKSSERYITYFVIVVARLSGHMSSEERDLALKTICQNPETFLWLLRTAERDDCPQSLLHWLRSQDLNDIFMLLCEHLTVTSKQVLTACATTAVHGGLVISTHSISSVLLKLCKASDNIEAMTCVAEILSALSYSLTKTPTHDIPIKDKSLVSSIERAVSVLFQVYSPLSEYPNLKDGWLNGLQILVNAGITDVNALVSELSQIVKQKLMHRNQLNSVYLESVVEDSVNAIQIMSSNFTSQELCSLLLDGFLPEYGTWKHQLKALCEDIESLLEGEHSSKVEKQLMGEECVNFIKFCLFSVVLTHKVVELVRGPDTYFRVNVTSGSSPSLVGHADGEGSTATPLEKQGEQKVAGEGENDLRERIAASGGQGSEVTEEDSHTPLDITFDQCTKEASAPKEAVGEMRSFLPEIEQTEEQSLKQHIDISHLEEKILDIALTAAMCNMLHEHFLSTAFYYNIQDYAEKMAEKFLTFAKLLDAEELLPRLLSLAIKKGREDGQSWINAAFLLCENKNEAVFRSVVCSDNYVTAIKALLKSARKRAVDVPLDFLSDFPSYKVTTLVLNLNSGSVSSSLKINEPIAEWQQLGHDDLLHDCDVSLKEDEVVNVVPKIKFLSACINKCPDLLAQQSWDFVLVSAAYYGQNMKKMMRYFFPSKKNDDVNVVCAPNMGCVAIRNVAMFSVAVFELLDSITRFCQRVDAKELTTENTNFEETVSEWKDVFAGDIQQVLFEMFIAASASIDYQVFPSLFGHVFLDKFCNLVKHIGFSAVFQQDSSHALKNNVLKASCSLILSSVPTLQMTAHSVVKECIPYIVEVDAVFINNVAPSPEENTCDASNFAIKPLLDAMQYAQGIVDTMLADFSFGSSCLVQPHTDTYYYTMAYLLSWDLLLQTCGQASSELRYQYATLLRNQGSLPNLLKNLFCLMPAVAVQEDLSKIKGPAFSYMFSNPPNPRTSTLCTTPLLQHFACWVYYSVISRLPVLVRQWWSDEKPRVSALVQRVTVQFVTPILCARQLQVIQNQNSKSMNMEIKVYSKARQVAAVYSVDEIKVELVITLPETYPLGAIHVDSPASLVGTSHWRNWVKQLTIFLTHQNGSLWDGLLLWKNNLEKRFEGIEECYICFSVIHGTNLQIPKLSCKTCRKRFHPPCLYKWFATSNKSTCPICRNIF